MNSTRDYWAGKHVVYRCFDAEGRLLYVGKSGDLPTRYEYHRAQTPWFGLVRRLSLRVYPSHEDGLAAEREAIRTESPAFNLRSAVIPLRRAKRQTRRLSESGRELLCELVDVHRLTVRDLALLCGDAKYRSAIGHLLSGKRDSCHAELAAALESVLLHAGSNQRLFLTDLRAVPLAS